MCEASPGFWAVWSQDSRSGSGWPQLCLCWDGVLEKFPISVCWPCGLSQVVPEGPRAAGARGGGYRWLELSSQLFPLLFAKVSLIFAVFFLPESLRNTPTDNYQILYRRVDNHFFRVDVLLEITRGQLCRCCSRGHVIAWLCALGCAIS